MIFCSFYWQRSRLELSIISNLRPSRHAFWCRGFYRIKSYSLNVFLDPMCLICLLIFNFCVYASSVNLTFWYSQDQTHACTLSNHKYNPTSRSILSGSWESKSVTSISFSKVENIGYKHRKNTAFLKCSKSHLQVVQLSIYLGTFTIIYHLIF